MKKYNKAGQDSDDNMVRAHCMLDTTDYRHTVKMCRVETESGGTRRSTGGEVKRKEANGVGSQYSSHYAGTWCIQHYYR